MSATADKATRREIRRAFGEGAQQVIDRQGQAIEALASTLSAYGREMAVDKKRLNELESKLATMRGMK